MEKQRPDTLEERMLQAAARWQAEAQRKREAGRAKSGIRDISGLADLLKPLNKEVKKHLRHPSSEWRDRWEKVVGPEIAQQTTVKGWKNGFLQVEVENPALKGELESYYATTLAETMREEFPEITLRGIRFLLGIGKA